MGIFIGGAYYQGEINYSGLFYQVNPSYGALYRFNLNKRFAFRANLIVSSLSGSDNDFTYGYQIVRNRTFSTPLVDLSGQTEFNFKNYHIGKKKYSHSPYVFLGLSFIIASYAENPYIIGIPFGVGYKQNIGKRFGIGLEWGYRKTFSDYIDNISGERIYPKIVRTFLRKSKLKQLGNFRNTDWYSIFGIFITYKLFPGRTACYIYND
ncbi:MAG TPA: hypothetical protein EYP69_06005 [Bacteroidales bacterium]|nr:hypothetical protein [Bacteroidales bacterium]